MSEPSPENPQLPIYAQAWAVRFGFMLIAAFTLIVGLAFLDKSRRPELESVSETTAVGDLQFLPVPDAAQLPATVATFNGQPLLVVDAKPLDIRDTHTRRLGRDAASGLSIYELSDAATPGEKERVAGKQVVLLKAAANQYLAAQTSAAP